MAPYRLFLALGAIIGALSACNQPASVISAPPPEWTAPVPEPTIPEGDSDEEVAKLIVDLFDRLREANNRLKRLDDWRAKLPE